MSKRARFDIFKVKEYCIPMRELLVLRVLNSPEPDSMELFDYAVAHPNELYYILTYDDDDLLSAGYSRYTLADIQGIAEYSFPSKVSEHEPELVGPTRYDALFETLNQKLKEIAKRGTLLSHSSVK